MTVAEPETCRFPGWFPEGTTTAGKTSMDGMTVVGSTVVEPEACRFPGWFPAGVAMVLAAIFVVVPPGAVAV